MTKINIIHSAVLSVLTIVVIVLYILFVDKLNNKLDVEFEVKWDNSTSVDLNPGPIWFRYDKLRDILEASKPITSEEKYKLLFLYPKERPADVSYISAIDNLAYISNIKLKGIFWLVIILGALGGVLGVMIRSLSSFVFHLCYLKDLDMNGWWSWYYLRPTMGAGVGVTVVVLSKSKLLNINPPGELTGFWILGLCILAGFAISEVTDRLYFTANTIFGGNGEGKKINEENKRTDD